MMDVRKEKTAMNKQKIHGYICRDKIGHLMFFTGRPKRNIEYECWVVDQNRIYCYDVPRALFPKITWEDEPREADMEIKLV